MKNYFRIIITIFISFLVISFLCGCKEEGNNIGKSNEDTFYYSGSLSGEDTGLSESFSLDGMMSLDDGNKINYYFRRKETLRKMDVEKTERFVPEFCDYSLKYVGTYVAPFDKTAENLLGIDYRYVDYYRYDDEFGKEYRAYYWRGTDIICQLSDRSIRNMCEPVEKSIAKENAIKFANEILGEQLVNQYSLVTENEPNSEYNLDRYYFCFAKNVFGYEINDFFWVYVNLDGKIGGYMATNLGKAASVKDKATIENGFAKLYAKLEEIGQKNGVEITVLNKSVTVQVNGDIYATVEFAMNNFGFYHEISVKVN